MKFLFFGAWASFIFNNLALLILVYLKAFSGDSKYQSLIEYHSIALFVLGFFLVPITIAGLGLNENRY